MAVYTPAHKPYDHQLKALAKMEGKEAFALLMAMRTGKTKVTIDDFGRLELAGKAKNFAVIAPAAVIETWQTAFNDHASFDLKKRARINIYRAGQSARAKKELQTFIERDTNDPRVLLINIEALSTVKDAQQTLVSFLKRGPNVTAIDESTIIKGDSKRTKFVLDNVAPNTTYRRILSGLPTPKDPLDLFFQFWFLDWKILGHRSFYSFRARYAVMKRIEVDSKKLDKNGKIIKRPVDIVVNVKNVDELYGRIEPYSSRVRLEDCYDMPESVWMFRYVEMTPEQKRLYNEMKKEATTEFNGSYASATNIVSRLIRMHQILCGHIVDEEGQIHPVPENRTDELFGILDDYDGKAIIWVAYDYDVRRVSEALKKRYGPNSVARFWGGNRATREGEELVFQTNPECRFMIATPAAGGRGRMWAMANLVIYYSSDPNLEYRSQSEERPKGVGKTDYITYIDLCTRGTVDELFINTLRKKMDLASVVMGDPQWKWLI
jgi:SNF2 family DNA or RNA helicase